MLRALCLATMLLGVPPRSAIADAPCDLGANAALKYWQGFAQLPKLDDAEQKKLRAECVTMPLDARVRGLVAKSDYALLMLHRGAALPHCEWAVGSEEGLRALLPHGQAARVMVPLACLRARIRFVEGHDAEAIDDIVDAMTLSRHITHNGLLIAVLLGDSLEQRAIETLAVALPRLSVATVRNLKGRLDALPPAESLAAAMRIEEKFALDWFARELKDANAKDGLLSFLSAFFGDEKDARAYLEKCGGDLNGALRFVEKTRSCYQEIPAKLELPPDQFTIEFSREEEKQARNPVFNHLFPDMIKVAWATARAKVRRGLLRAAIAVRLGGPAALKDHPDPVAGGPFEYVPFDGGFELRANLKMDGKLPAKFQLDEAFNKPLVLLVGRPGK